MTVRLQPGEMDQIVGLYKPTVVKDAFGQHTEYALVANVAARVKPLAGRDFFAAAATQNLPTVNVTIYWRIDVQANWRVHWMARWLEISNDPIDIDARHDALDLMCSGVPL